jgi:hypothetical protein
LLCHADSDSGIVVKSRPPSCRAKALSGLRAGACGGLAVVLAVFSLLLQALLPLIPTASASGTANRPMAALCLTQDASLPGPHGTPVRQEPGQGAPVCAVCLGLHLVAAYVPPPALAIPLPRLVHDVRAATPTGKAPVAGWSAAPQARGPPVAA